MIINPLYGQITIGVYAVLLALGGALGFVKARSRASLISGSLSAFFAVVALGLMRMNNHRLGVSLGLLLAFVLFILFGFRYAVRNRKFMPSGMLAVVSLVVLGVMVISADWTH